MDDDPPVSCSTCGVEDRRSAMFGVEPDLQCDACAQGIRKRMHVRFRPLPRDTLPIVTYGIIGICAVLFLVDNLGFANTANQPLWLNHLLFLHLYIGPQVWSGDIVSLWSHAFFHLGWMHVIFNMWWTRDLGRAVESGFGRWAMILIVLGCAPVAGGAEWMINGGGRGFSGVVYGLAFFLYVHRKTNPHAAMIMNQRTANFLGGWFVLCIVLTVTNIMPIANWAHGIGGLWGLMVGFATLHRRRRILVPLAAVLTIAFVAMVPFVAFWKQAPARAHDLELQAEDAAPIHRLNEYYRVRYGLDPSFDPVDDEVGDGQ